MWRMKERGVREVSLILHLGSEGTVMPFMEKAEHREEPLVGNGQSESRVGHFVTSV